MMKNIRFAFITSILSLAVLMIPLPWPTISSTGMSLASSDGLNVSPSETMSHSSALAAQPQTSATIIRTIVYKQITDFQSAQGISIHQMKLSGDGSKIVFSMGRGTPKKVSRSIPMGLIL